MKWKEWKNELKEMKWKEWKKNLFLFTNYIVNERSHLHASDDFLGLFVCLFTYFFRQEAMLTCKVAFRKVLSNLFSLTLKYFKFFDCHCLPDILCNQNFKILQAWLTSTDKAFDVVCPRSKHHRYVPSSKRSTSGSGFCSLRGRLNCLGVSSMVAPSSP